MFFQINGFNISNLQKSTKNPDVISVDIIANHLTNDSDEERILKEAFDDETVKTFLDIGVVEFWHETKTPNLTKEEKLKNILGKPTGFRWENEKPVVTADLTKKHPLVSAMLPHLEANQPVYAASVGGSKVVVEVKDKNGNKQKIIPKIKWDHLAIAPASHVINREPGLNIRLLEKANSNSDKDILCEFDNMNSFLQNKNIIEKEEDLKKALLAPSSNQDLYTTPGGVLTKQSIEQSPVDLTLSDQDGIELIDTIIKIKNNKISTNKDEYLNYFNKKNMKKFGQKSFDLINKFFKLKKKERR